MTQKFSFSMGETGDRAAVATTAAFEVPPIVERLIAAHPDLDIRGQQGMTPLHVAAMMDDDVSVAHLLAAGATRDLADDNGKTPLDLAREPGRPRARRVLEGV